VSTPEVRTDETQPLAELALALADSFLSDEEAVAALRRAGDDRQLEQVLATLDRATPEGPGLARTRQLLGQALPPRADHLVAFYEDDAFLVAATAEFVGEGLQRGETVLVVATPEHRAGFEAALREAGHDLDGLGRGRYEVLDAADRLSTLVHDGLLDVGRFQREIGGWLERATAGGRRVRVYGEMVALLWEAGHLATAIELEGLWNGLIEEHAFPILCGYPMRGFDTEETTALFHAVCEQHTGVTTESYTPLSGRDDEASMVVLERDEAGGRPVRDRRR
jgi:hypothetical protein